MLAQALPATSGSSGQFAAKASMKRLATLSFVAVLSFLTGGWFLHREPTEEERLYEQARVLGTVLSVIHDHSLESADQNELFQNTARNLVAQLDRKSVV